MHPSTIFLYACGASAVIVLLWVIGRDLIALAILWGRLKERAEQECHEALPSFKRGEGFTQ